MNTSPRPTTYCGIRMRSRLEAKFAARYDALGLKWEYEPQAFASEHGEYLPDFRITSASGARWYVEVKGPPIADPGLLQTRMEIVWASEPNARLFLADSTGQWWTGIGGTWTSAADLPEVEVA